MYYFDVHVSQKNKTYLGKHFWGEKPETENSKRVEMKVVTTADLTTIKYTYIHTYIHTCSLNVLSFRCSVVVGVEVKLWSFKSRDLDPWPFDLKIVLLVMRTTKLELSVTFSF